MYILIARHSAYVLYEAVARTTHVKNPYLVSHRSVLQYISKNAPATERVIRHGTETSGNFSGSRMSSRSHHSSTATHASSHRYRPCLSNSSYLSLSPYLSILQVPYTYLRHTSTHITTLPSVSSPYFLYLQEVHY